MFSLRKAKLSGFIVLFVLCAVLRQPVKAQSVINLTPYPNEVTDNQTAYIVASTMFTSGGCELYNYNVTINYLPFVPIVQVTATYCIGMLTVICERTDTIPLGVLPSGFYNVQFTVLTGMFDGNGCQPPYMQGGTASSSLVVNPATGMQVTVIDTETSFNPFCSRLDTLNLFADLMFTTGDCALQNYTVDITSPNAATITATYCVGDLTVICNQQNTFTIAPLNYTGGDVALTLVIKNCYTGNILGTYTPEVFSATVEPCLGVEPTVPVKQGLSLVQNLVWQELQFDFGKIEFLMPDELHIFTPDGRLAAKSAIAPIPQPLSFTLPAGLYIYAVYSKGIVIDKGKAVVAGK